MIIGRMLGWLLIIGGLATVVHDLVEWLQTGEFGFEAAGELWYRLDAASLNSAQSLIQRFTLPEIWDPGIVSILLLPAPLVLLVPGVILVLAFKSKRRRSRLMS